MAPLANQLGLIVTSWSVDLHDLTTSQTQVKQEFRTAIHAHGKLSKFISVHHDASSAYSDHEVMESFLQNAETLSVTLVGLDQCLNEASPYRDSNEDMRNINMDPVISRFRARLNMMDEFV